MSAKRSKPKLSTARQEAHLKVLRAIHADSTMSQRDLSRKLGISLGKTNYCVQALLQLGLIKTRNFKNSKNKAAYTYLLTSKGVEQKWKLTVAFLEMKQQEFELLRVEIEQLKYETSQK